MRDQHEASFHSFQKSSRSTQPELMDGDDFSPEELDRTLQELELINRLTNGYAPTIAAIERAAKRRERSSEPLRVLDIGSGHGDTLRAVHGWAEKTGTRVELVGVDMNPIAKKSAERSTPDTMRIRFVTCDIFKFEEASEYDVMINSLFLHHLDDDRIIQLLKWMAERARIAWFVNDLQRHAFAYHFVKHATRLLGFTRLVQHDAPVSVARGFVNRDWDNYLDLAGIDRASVEVSWHWPFRYGVYCDTQKARRHRGGRE